MAGLRPVIEDVLNKLREVKVVNLDQSVTNLFALVWNNQLDKIKDGSGYNFPRPAAFLEIATPVTFQPVGQGYRSADLGLRIHLIDEFFNTDGTYEQNLQVFDLRDQIIAYFAEYCPVSCGPMVCINEEQDYDHDNLYHYVLEFVCNFIDSKGSRYEAEAGNFTNEADANLDLEVVNGGVPEAVADDEPYYIIAQNN